MIWLKFKINSLLIYCALLSLPVFSFLISAEWKFCCPLPFSPSTLLPSLLPLFFCWQENSCWLLREEKFSYQFEELCYILYNKKDFWIPNNFILVDLHQQYFKAMSVGFLEYFKLLCCAVEELCVFWCICFSDTPYYYLKKLSTWEQWMKD